MMMLDQVAAIYANYRILSLSFHVTPSVGTTKSGHYICGVDYDHEDLPDTMAGVGALSPKIHKAIWQTGVLRVNPSRAMKSKWHFCGNSERQATDIGPACKLVIYARNTETSALTMQVWAKYTIEFTGPEPKQATKSLVYARDKKVVNGEGETVSSVEFDKGTRYVELEMQFKSGMAPPVTKDGVKKLVTDSFTDFSKSFDDLVVEVNSIFDSLTYVVGISMNVLKQFDWTLTTLASAASVHSFLIHRAIRGPPPL